jgi:hypothetical protein
MDDQTDKGNRYIWILNALVYLFVHRRYSDCPCLSSSIVGILIALTNKDNQYTGNGWRQTRVINYLRWTNKQTREINIPTMDDQTDKGNRYTSCLSSSIAGILIVLVCLFVHHRYIDCLCLSVRPSQVYWLPLKLSVCSSIVGILNKQGQSIYRQWMQTDKGNQLPTMDKQTDKGNQYAYDGRTDRQRQSIYLR